MHKSQGILGPTIQAGPKQLQLAKSVQSFINISQVVRQSPRNISKALIHEDIGARARGLSKGQEYGAKGKEYIYTSTSVT